MRESNGTELWAPIPSYEGYYEASTAGQVRSIDRLIYYKDGRTRLHPGRLLSPTPHVRSGHLIVKLWMANLETPRYVHQLVLESFVGPCPPNMEGRHIDDDPANNNISNLCWGSRRENMLDRQRNGIDHGRNKVCCPRSHLLVLPNLVGKDLRKGHRSCLACARAKCNEYYALSCGREFDFRVAANLHYAKIMAGGPHDVGPQYAP